MKRSFSGSRGGEAVVCYDSVPHTFFDSRSCITCTSNLCNNLRDNDRGICARARKTGRGAGSTALRFEEQGQGRPARRGQSAWRVAGGGAVRALVEALSDKEASVREAAAFALGQISDPAATALLIPLLADPEPSVRASTAFALGMIGDRKATEALSFATGDADAEVRASAIFALGLMRDEGAVDELIRR